MTRTTRTLSVTLARIAAVLLSVSVVAYLVWRAQREAEPVDPAPPVGEGYPHDGPQPAVDPDVILLPSTKDPGPDTLVFSSKFATLPESKYVKLPESKPVTLPSSKSLVIDPDSPVKPRRRPGGKRDN